MSELKVNKITPKTGTSIQLGESGDTITIPCGATLTNNGTATGFGLSFCTTVKTSPFTATANKGFLINTGSAVTVTLPASPTTGAEVIIVDQTGQAATNGITLGRNGSKIKGGCSDLLMSTNRGGLRLVYSGSSQGWITATAGNDATAVPAFISATGGNTVLTCGNFKTHIFTADGNFVVDNVGQPGGSTTVEYLVIAGGAGGGDGSGSGGGGAGGYRTTYPSPTTAGLSVSAQTYPITVGAGGGASASPGARGSAGANSVFSTITSAGGGGGGSENPCVSNVRNGQAGGSGGGAETAPGGGGAGNTPPVSPPQGSNGGNGGGAYSGGGGGGASAVGGNGKPCGPGLGGAGTPIATAYFGPTSGSYGTPGPSTGRYFAGGGGGGNQPPASPTAAQTGGAGGGGTGAVWPSTQGTAGTANTGGGGGGGLANPSVQPNGSGGSGFVAIRYKFQ